MCDNVCTYIAGSTVCISCDAGKYAEGGASQCISCNAGTYSVSVGATSASACLICPGSSDSYAGRSSCCGDGIKTTSEACDDGNTAASDGCSALCLLEDGYLCTGQPSKCSASAANDDFVKEVAKEVMVGIIVGVLGTIAITTVACLRKCDFCQTYCPTLVRWLDYCFPTPPTGETSPAASLVLSPGTH